MTYHALRLDRKNSCIERNSTRPSSIRNTEEAKYLTKSISPSSHRNPTLKHSSPGHVTSQASRRPQALLRKPGEIAGSLIIPTYCTNFSILIVLTPAPCPSKPPQTSQACQVYSFTQKGEGIDFHTMLRRAAPTTQPFDRGFTILDQGCEKGTEKAELLPRQGVA